MTSETSPPALLKICFIISSIGGPRMLAPLFSNKLREDIAYIVIQRLAGSGLLDVLVECLREEVKCKTLVAGHSLHLQGGAIHFLPNERNYVFQGNKFVTVDLPGSNQLSLDHLFNSILDIPNPCAIAVLSGMLTDDDGIIGLTNLKASGVPITGTMESNTSVFDMIEQLQNLGLISGLFPPKYLLENLHFNENDKDGSKSDSNANQSPRILVVDDEALTRNVIVEMLRTHGMSVDFAADGLDALRKLQKIRYDALILDLHMPEMDGIKTLEALKTLDPKLPIVVMTGSDDHAKIQAAKEFNVLGVLQKPIAWEKLKKILPHPKRDAAAS
jgi:CheY-like chemotaxis protein